MCAHLAKGKKRHIEKGLFDVTIFPLVVSAALRFFLGPVNFLYHMTLFESIISFMKSHQCNLHNTGNICQTRILIQYFNLLANSVV
jgi:hypothetical protein